MNAVRAKSPGVGKELRYLSDPPDILRAILRGKAQVTVQSMPDVVPVQHVRAETELVKAVVDRVRQGALAAPRESREPQDRSPVPVPTLALVTGYVPFVPVHVRRLLRHDRVVLSLMLVQTT